MKKLTIYIFSFAFIFSNCSDLKEVPTRGLSPEGYFKSASDVEAMIFGTYGLMASSNYYGNGLTTPLQMMSDMIDLGFDYSNYSHFNSFIHESTNTYLEDLWNTSYQIIATANSAINGVTILEDFLTEDQQNELKAEALFVRSLVYYHLVRLFGEVPHISSVNFGDPTTITKESVENIYSNIIRDLEFAYDYLPTEHPDGIRSRPSRGSAATMLASVYLTRENWTEAYNYSKWVIDNAIALDYGLESDFQNLWRADLQGSLREYIFFVDFAGDQRGNNPNPITLENDHVLGAFNSVDGGLAPHNGWSMLVPGLAVYATWDANDYRRRVSIDDERYLGDDGLLHPYTDFKIPRPHAAKFNRFPGVTKGNTAGWRSDMDYVVFRYAEVLLIAAESANELGDTPEAVGYLNQVRARARNGGVINFSGNSYTTYGPSTSPADITTSVSQDAFRDIVIEERRLELAFEFKRWYDIVRRDLGEEAFGPSGLEPQPNFNKSLHYQWPLPQAELNKSPQLGSQK